MANKRESRRSWRGAAALGLICCLQLVASSERLVFTTSYPSPAGVYQLLLTTGGSLADPRHTILARDAGSVGIGTAAPRAKLEVAGNAIMGGSLRLGADASPCVAAKEGALRYDAAGKRMEFCNGLAWAPVGDSGPRMSKYGANQRCKDDEWIFICGFRPGASWEWNYCLSRGHAVTYNRTLVWIQTAGGYRYIGGAFAPMNADVYCGP